MNSRITKAYRMSSVLSRNSIHSRRSYARKERKDSEDANPSLTHANMNSGRSEINFVELGAPIAPFLRSPDESRAQIPNSGCLVILDIHGVLVERISKTKDKVRLEQARSHGNPWRRRRHYWTWLRPHLRKFLEVASARHNVAVWSSAKSHTIDEFLSSISREYEMDPPYEQRLTFKWDRTKCKPALDVGPYATMKYMRDLWEHPAYKDRFSSRNTLLLDDSPHKNRDFPNSGIVVPEYRADVLQDRYRTDDTLLWILLYIEYLLAESRQTTPDGVLMNISESRENCVTLQEFIEAGMSEAVRLTSNQQRRRLRSLALVFLEGVASASEANDANVNTLALATSTAQ